MPGPLSFGAPCAYIAIGEMPMPYEWIRPRHPGPLEPVAELHLWPYRSLPRRGFVAFIGVTAGMIAVPLVMVVGSPVLWGLLPFLLIVLAGLWWGLERNYRDGTVLEELSFFPDRLRLVRHNPRGPDQEWEANPHWAQLHMHATGGPVPNYVTLKGNGREIEIGAFLSEDERKVLHDELAQDLAKLSAMVPAP